MSSSLSEEDNVRCWEYVMNYTLDEIHKNDGLEINQLCIRHIQSKESFNNYVEDKRKSIRCESEKKDGYEKENETGKETG